MAFVKVEAYDYGVPHLRSTAHKLVHDASFRLSVQKLLSAIDEKM